MRKMKKHMKLLMITSILLLDKTFAAIPNTNDPNTFLGPTIRGAFTSSIGNESAFSIAGEAGVRSARVSGTVAWEIGNCARFKATAEYMWQHITFGFFSGDAERWGQQGDVGVEYQWDAPYPYFHPQWGFNAYLSYSPADTFGIEEGSFINAQGIYTTYSVNRRGTGSRGYGASPVLTISPWQGSKIRGEVNYDNVGYDNDWPVNQNAFGFGGTLSIHQMVNQTVDVGAMAAIRQPFNSFSADITFNCIPYLRNWTLKAFGEYTVGKHTLPSTYNVGLAADFFLDRRAEIIDVTERNIPVTRPVVDNLMAFTAAPAIYMPVVLSVKDQDVTLS